MPPRKRKNPFIEEKMSETGEADKHLFLDVYNICKSLNKDTKITTNKVINDIPTVEDIQIIIDDFENGNALTKFKLQNIVKVTTSFKNIQSVEDKIKTSKKRLTAIIAECMWNVGINKTNFNKEQFITFLKTEMEKKETKNSNNKDIVMK